MREPAEKILNALTPEVLAYLQDKNPSYYSPAENRFSLENRFKRCCESMQDGKALDEKGNTLLVKAGALRILAGTAFDISQNAELLKQSGLSQTDVNTLFETERKADSEFYKHRDRLKHNKDGSLKLEDFGENLNNTRKGRGSGKISRPDQFLYEPMTEIEKRLAAEPLDKVWPKASLIELHKTNPRAAACLWLVRDEISGRKPPKSSYKYKCYLKTASAAIALHRQIITGELAPEAQSEAFDSFYGARSHYKLFALVNSDYWNAVSPGVFENAANICKWNGLRLSDGTDINSYPYQCAISGHADKDPDSLFLVDQEGHRIPVFTVVVAHTEEEFKEKLNHQIELLFAAELEAAGKSKTGKDSSPGPKKELPITFLGRGNRQTHTYEVYGKQGTIELQLTDKITFESDDEFWKYVASHRAELTGKYKELRAEYSKTEKDWRSNSPIRDRQGPNYRKGKDATPEMFQNTFGFRGVEFGNWVRQGKNSRERQWMLNNAYDSLYDLSKILNIPPKAVALNGDLGLCFGSRGFGSASAHYEPENRIINLTKTKGYSSLAHEWFHALDHHMACDLYEAKLFESKFLSDNAEPVRFGLSETYKENLSKQIETYSKTPDAVVESIESKLTSNPLFPAVSTGLVLETVTHHAAFKDGRSVTYSLKHQITKDDLREIHFEHETKLRPQVFHAWGDVVEAIRASSMHQRMKKKNAYWQSKIEEAARSFEAFVEVRSKELGIQNDFLTNGAFSREEVSKNSFYPYLDGKDVNVVKEKFEKLFETIKTRDTEKGVKLYSKTREKKTGSTVSEIQTALEKKFGKKVIKHLIDSQKLEIVSNMKELEKHLIGHALLESKRNKKTGFIVPDSLVNRNNPIGSLAKIDSAACQSIPRGEIVVLPGRHSPLSHSGQGARHLTGTVIEEPSRNLFSEENNKTEAGLKTALKVLSEAEELYKESQGRRDAYHFYSRKLGMAVCTYYDGEKYVVLTQKPVKNPEKIWEKQIASLKGALEIPFSKDSDSLPSSIQGVNGKLTERQPATALEETYVDVDYTAKISAEIKAARTAYRFSIGGLYSSTEKKSYLIADSILSENAPTVLLHEVGIHMAFDSVLRNKVKPLIEQAPRLLEEGFTRRDPVCMAAEIRLKDAGITKEHSNYAEESAAYLVEECERRQSRQPAVVRWASEFKSVVNVWLIDHNFRSVKELTPQDYVTIAKANIQTLANRPNLQKTSDKNTIPYFSLNKQHREILKTLKETLPMKNTALQNTNLLNKVLNEVQKRMYECERKGKVFQFKEDLTIRPPFQKQRKEVPKFVSQKNNVRYDGGHQK